MLTMWFMASTPSSAERPWSGALAACADTPRKRNLADLLASDAEGFALFTPDGCQCNTASTSPKRPPRTMYTLPAPPSSAGVP